MGGNLERNGKYSVLRALVVGLGSMGKRRVRCLRALGVKEIHGFDPRADRCQEASAQYGIRTAGQFPEALAAAQPDVVIVSAPPHVHHLYMEQAAQRGIPFFVEVSILDTEREQIMRHVSRQRLVAAPSATMVFHPGIRLLMQTLQTGQLGKVSNLIYHAGQYLLDWHPYEKLADYYVSRRATGGARELVPFELTWLVAALGFPKRVAANVRKTIHLEGAEDIDDTYDCLLDFGDCLAVFVVDVVSRFATRRLLVNGDKQQLVWDWAQREVRLYDPASKQWTGLSYDQGTAAAGYNVNIGELMYVEEIAAFLEAVLGGCPFPNSLANDYQVLQLLYRLEQAAATGQTLAFAPA